MPAVVRVPSYAVWETAVFVLNALALVMIGLQLELIVLRIGTVHRYEGFRFADVILIAVIDARAAWMLFYNGALRVMTRVLAGRAPEWMRVSPWKGSPCLERGAVCAAS